MSDSAEAVLEETADVAEEDDIDHRDAQANDSVRNHMLGAMGMALIPSPGLDLAAVVGVQLKMIHALAGIYGVEFKEHVGKSLIGTLIGGYGMASIATGAVYSLMKAIPGIGQLAGTMSLPVVFGAATYALGQVFRQHFASGGTFLDFDPAKVREFFVEQYRQGEEIARASQDAAKE